jgi:polysaccharide export outer membrane protein
MWALASAHVGHQKRPSGEDRDPPPGSVFAGFLGGCKRSAVPGLTTPDFALSTPAPLPAPGHALPEGAGSAPPGVPVVPNETYTLDSGDHVRVIVFG